MEAQHALQVPVVVQNLFTIMAPTISFADLKSVRCVCRPWYQESLSFWRKTAVITFHNKPFFSPVSSGGTHPAVFLAELNNSQDFYVLDTKPYEKYKLVDVELNTQYLQENKEVVKFWALLGPKIKHLTFDQVKFTGGSYPMFQEMLLDILRENTPNLEHLNLSEISSSDWGITDTHGLFSKENTLPSLKSLTLDYTADLKLANFPNLQELKLAENTDLIDMFVDHENFINSSLKTLDLIDNTRASYQNTFAGPVFLKSLQHLTLTVGYDDGNFNMEQLSSSLQNHSTIQSLHLLQWNFYFKFSSSSPFKNEMNALRELKLWGRVVPDMSFLRYMQNLKTIHIDVLGFGKENLLRQRLQSHNVLTPKFLPFLKRDLVKATLRNNVMTGVHLPELTSLFLSCSLSTESVRALGEWMPNVKILKAILDSTTLPIVIDQWKGLEVLHCLFESCIADEDLAALNKLKGLRSFKYDALCDSSKLTSATPILDCKELTHLQVGVSAQFPVEEESHLGDKIQFVKIHRNHSVKPVHDTWKCCKFKKLYFGTA